MIVPYKFLTVLKTGLVVGTFEYICFVFKYWPFSFMLLTMLVYGAFHYCYTLTVGIAPTIRPSEFIEVLCCKK